MREALRQEVSADDLIDFIEANGGVEQIRLGGTKPLSIKDRAEEVKEEVLSADLGMISFDDKLFAGDPDWTDKQVVIVATYFSTGEFQANAVKRCMFFFSTNYLEKLDRGIINRCHLIEMNQVDDISAYVPIGQQLLQGMGLNQGVVSNTTIEKIASQARGSMREFFDGVVRLGLAHGGHLVKP